MAIDANGLDNDARSMCAGTGDNLFFIGGLLLHQRITVEALRLKYTLHHVKFDRLPRCRYNMVSYAFSIGACRSARQIGLRKGMTGNGRLFALV